MPSDPEAKTEKGANDKLKGTKDIKETKEKKDTKVSTKKNEIKSIGSASRVEKCGAVAFEKEALK